ncbi:hypothetical protein [Pseudomonas qingdaonensis]|uniref:hypothetical protein n=1 Tax=Pseudomonas qingdaonensis TaxID=2056231 RepID=UPI002E18B7FB|nr:hypothetical protein [Pseudomonas qingdaonensis]
MTQQQVIALIVICAFVAGLYTLAFITGLRRGRQHINAEQQAAHTKATSALELSLSFLRADHRQLAQHSKKLREAYELKEQHHQVLLQIAENLRIAAETFSAFKTGKKLERDARTLREQALSMAALIKPLDQEQAA